MFSCEFCEIFNNTFFTEHFRTTASAFHATVLLYPLKISSRKKWVNGLNDEIFTTQKMKFSTKDFFSKCDQIRKKLRVWSHLLKKSFMENLIFCEVLESFKWTYNFP